MGMGVENPLQPVSFALDVAKQLVRGVCRSGPGLQVEVEDRIDDGAPLCLRVRHDVLDAGCALLEEAFDNRAFVKALGDCCAHLGRCLFS